VMSRWVYVVANAFFGQQLPSDESLSAIRKGRRRFQRLENRSLRRIIPHT
jgi:hypothetical protein